MQSIVESDLLSDSNKEILTEFNSSKKFRKLIYQINKPKEKPRLYSGRSKSPKLNLYSYFKETATGNTNMNIRPVTTTKPHITRSKGVNMNQTNFRTNTKFNNIEIEAEKLKEIVTTQLKEVFFSLPFFRE